MYSVYETDLTKKQGPPKKPVKTTRAEQRAETRERVRQAAWELFSTVGFDETTTGAIAERAGVAAGTVFLHGADKPDLLFLVMHGRLESTVNKSFESLPDAPLVDRLMHLFRGVFEMYDEHPKMSAAFVKLLPGSNGPNAQQTNIFTMEFLTRVAGLIEEAQRRGEVAPDLMPLLCAQNVFGLYFMSLLTWLSGLVTLEDALNPGLRMALELQMRGFRA